MNGSKSNHTVDTVWQYYVIMAKKNKHENKINIAQLYMMVQLLQIINHKWRHSNSIVCILFMWFKQQQIAN